MESEAWFMDLRVWGLLVLVAVLLLAGATFLRRRKRSVAAVARQALATTKIQISSVSSASTLRERLIEADFGSAGIDRLLCWLEAHVSADRMSDGSALLEAVKGYYRKQLQVCRPLEFNPEIGGLWLIAGVNGAGKTTTIAKLADRWQKLGVKVVVGACDTFRAAATEQLQSWGDKLDFRVVTGGERTDPAAVAHNTVSSAQARGEKVVLIDTAGRLHGDANLMRELEKVHRIGVKAAGREFDEVLLILDANQGQNLRRQIEEFGKTLPLTGIILTKYDGTGRGGAAIDSLAESGLPLRAIGVGEGANDLVEADPEWILQRLFG